MLRLFRTRRSHRRALVEAIGDALPPSLPQLTLKALQLLRDPDASMSRIGQLISADPGMSVVVLKAINCVGHGMKRRIDSASHAVNLLGRRRVESLVLVQAISERLPCAEGGAFDIQAFWSLSAYRATLARRLTLRHEPSSADLAFTAALLQDMSIPLLFQHNPGAYGALLSRWRRREIELHGEEQERFGWDHAQVSRWLGERWNLSDDLLEAIGSHHDEQTSPPAVRMVSGLREPDDPPGTALILQESAALLGLSQEQAQDVIDLSREEARALGSALVT